MAALALASLASSPRVKIIDGRPMTLSTDVADYFGKRHDNVMKAIRSLDIPDDARALNFEETSISVRQPNGGVRKVSAYSMTRDGFTLLVMGFTGKTAMQFKLAYIKAFNRMEAELQERNRRPFAPDLQNRIWYRSQAVLPSTSLATFYGTDAKTLSTIARDTRGLFERGKHYWVAQGADLDRLYTEAETVAIAVLPTIPPARNGIMLFPESGAKQLALAVGRNAMDAFVHLRRTYYSPKPDHWQTPAITLDSALQRAERLLTDLHRQAAQLRPAVASLTR